jgi:hypothetical protein
MNTLNYIGFLLTLFIIFFVTSGSCLATEYEDLDITYDFFTITEENKYDIHGELWVHLAWKASQNENVKYYYVYWNGEFSSWDSCCHRNIPMFKHNFRGHTRDQQMQSFETAVEECLSTSHTFGVKGRMPGGTFLVFDEVVYEPILKALHPNPPDNFTALAWNTSLIWTPGDFSYQHNVYFGNSFDAVYEAEDTDTSGIYRANQIGQIYNIPEALEFGRTYFWRIDEITNSGIVYQGDVWCFTVADYLTVDNFENYTDFFPNRIFDIWIDGYGNDSCAGNGTGAIVGHRDGPPYTESNIVHNGNQSMLFSYNNNKPNCFNYSETSIIWSKPRDLTSEGVQELSLWFRGDPGASGGSIESMLDISSNNGLSGDSSLQANDAEQLYIGISNSNGKVSVLNHPNPNATQLNDWTEWRIPLVNFSTEETTLTDVNSLFIGVGSRDNPRSGGSGKLYFDDIRLYEFRGGDPTDIINTGFEMNQDNIEAIVSTWIGNPWILSSKAYSGNYSIRSGDIEDDQSSGFQVIIDSTAGTIFNVSFAVKTSTENLFDILTFSVNGIVKTGLSGDSDWTIYTFPILVEGEQLVLEWVYKKDRSFSFGDDTVWLDELLIQELQEN